MSSDEEELTGRQKRSASLAKRGRNRISTLADDDDDDGLFENPEEENSEGDGPKFKEVDVTFSPASLKKALQKLRLKGCISPEPADSFEPKTWKDMEKEIREKGINLQELETLVKYLNKADNLSLEYKCLVISIARQTCLSAKSKEDTKKAQELFKSKDKGNKTNHVANFVSNTWFWESFGHLQKIGAVSTSMGNSNMHVVLVECSLQFMRDSYVINSEKKMNVLKERQQIDWVKAVQKATKLASGHKIASMSAEAGLTKSHFESFKEGNKPAADDATGAKDGPSDSAEGAAASSVQDMAKKKRLERLQNLRRRVSATSLQNSTGNAAGTSGSSATNQVARRPSDLTTIAEASKAVSTTNNVSSAKSSSWGTTSSVETKSSWGKPQQERPSTWGAAPSPASPADSHPTPAPAPSGSSYSGGQPDSSGAASSWGTAPAASAPAKRPSWGDPAGSSTRHTTSWGSTNGAHDTASRTAIGEPQSRSSWENSASSSDAGPSSRHPIDGSERRSPWNDSANSSGPPSRSPPGEPQRRSSWENSAPSSGAAHDADGYANRQSRSNNQGYDQHRDADRNYNRDPYPDSSSRRSDRMQTSSTSVVGDSGSAEPRGGAWGNSAPNAAAYSAGSAHDNQTDGPAGYDQQWSYGGGRTSSHEDSYNQGGSNSSSTRDNYGQGGSHSSSRRESYNQGGGNASSHQDSYSQGGSNYSQGQSSYGKRARDQDTSRRQEYNGDKRQRYDNAPRGQDNGAMGRGRGRGRTLPAWMTNSDGPAPPSEGPPPAQPRAEYNREPPPRDPQRNFPPPREASVALQANGRGRGRTLPAWMTQNEDGPQSQQSGAPQAPPERGGFPEPSRGAPVELQGTGRGRGRTLPAWMTQK